MKQHEVIVTTSPFQKWLKANYKNGKANMLAHKSHKSTTTFPTLSHLNLKILIDDITVHNKACACVWRGGLGVALGTFKLPADWNMWQFCPGVWREERRWGERRMRRWSHAPIWTWSAGVYVSLGSAGWHDDRQPVLLVQALPETTREGPKHKLKCAMDNAC